MILKRKILHYLKIFRFLFFPLYFFSFLIPRDKNIWLFGSSQDRFSENAKALFLYASEHEKSIQSIWITGNKKLCKQLQKLGYLSLYRWSIKGLYFSLKAKYYFYNSYTTDINFYTSGNATLVNLWHGIPLKQIEFDIQSGPLYKMFHTGWAYFYIFLKPYMFKKPNYVISTSTKVSQIFSSAFRLDIAQCLPFGYPRNDTFFSLDYQDLNLYETKIISIDIQNLKTKGHKILIYMPTWRSANKNFFNDAFPDFNKLNDILRDNTLIMIIKPHPNTSKIEEKYSNIIFIDSQIDIYTLLPLSDYLITDYSSIYFDYLLLNKEIIFYAFDHVDYIKEDRGLYFDYQNTTPGQKVYTFENLLSHLSKLEELNFSKERQEIKNEFWDFKDGDSSKRIYEYFLKL